MGIRAEQLLDDDTESEAWESTPEGRAVLAEHRAAEASRRLERLELEQRWARQRPLEWAAWLRIRPLMPGRFDFFAPEYGFEEFFIELGPAPSHEHHVARKDDLLTCEPGNMEWRPAGGRTGVKPPAIPPEAEYLTLRQVAAMTGLSYDFVRDQALAGELLAAQKGRVWRVRGADVHNWMDRGRAATAPPPRSELREKVSRFFPARKR